MTTRRTVILFAIATACGWLASLSCTSTNSPVAGGTSETTNGVTACAVRANGIPAAGATVRLRRSDYLTAVPSLAKQSDLIGADALTDSAGRFEITGIEPGGCRIEVSDPASRQALLLGFSLDKGETADLGTDTLRPFAAVSGSVDLSVRPQIKRYVQVEGLERLVAVDSAGRYTIPNLPAGSFNLRIIAEDTSSVKPVTIDSVAAVSGGATTAPLAGWRFSKRLYANTTATGAGVSEDVRGFPLLVRLDASNFDFSQAQVSGQDLRFSNPGGTPLPYEIEQWDAAAQVATVWVRMDTVRGNDSTQFIIMHYGNPSAMSMSNSAAVFDKANGFTGVWHCDGIGDATGNGNNAVYENTVVGSGIIGPARIFSNGSRMLVSDSPDLEPQSFTLSCWVKISGPQPMRFSKFMAKGIHGSGPLWCSYSLEMRDRAVGFQIVTIDSVPHPIASIDTAVDSAWHLLTGVYDGQTGAGEFFMDGVSQGTFQTNVPIQYYIDQNHDLLLGSCEDIPYYFNGMLDEARIRWVVESAAEVKLNYQSQRKASLLIRFGK